MKKLLLIILTIAMIFAVVGCSEKPATSDPTSGVDDERTPTMKIGFMVPTLQSEFFVGLAEAMKDVFAENGYETIVASFDADQNKAISTVENFIISDVDCIIAMVSDGSCDSALKSAMDKGIKVVVPGVETAYYDLCMLADNIDVGTKIGEMAADFINSELDGEADVVALISTSSIDMADRSNAMIETLQELAPNANIVGKTEYAGVGTAAAAMENFLQQYPDIKVVISFGDQGALEAIEVVKAANKGSDDFGAFGCDATLQGLKIISEGGLFRGTVYMGDLVENMTSKTLRLLEGDTTLEKRDISKNTKVTAENVSDFID